MKLLNVNSFKMAILAGLISIVASVAYAQNQSRQGYMNASALLAQNFELLVDIDTGNSSDLKTAQTIVEDMNALIFVIEKYEKTKASKIISQIDGLEEQANALRKSLSNAGKLQLDEQLILTLNKVDELSFQKVKYQNTLKGIAGIKNNISAINKLITKAGTGLSILDTGSKGIALVKAIQADAGKLEKFQAEGDFVLSAATTTLAISAPNALPPIAIASFTTAATSWMVDTTGDVVRDGATDRINQYYRVVTEAESQIKNAILNAHRYGKPYTSLKLKEVVDSSLYTARYKLSTFKGKAGASEYIFGVKKAEEKALEHALSLIETMLDGRAFRRAILLNEDVRKTVSDIEKFNSNVDAVVQTASEFDKMDLKVLRSDTAKLTKQIMANTANKTIILSKTTTETKSNLKRQETDQVGGKQEQALLESQNLREERSVADERRKEARRQTALVDAVNERQSLEQSKKQAEEKLKEARNLVTVLRYNEAEKAKNELREINAEIQSFRDRKQASAGFDQLQFRQGVLKGELEKLNAVLKFRRGITTPSAVSASQKRTLNKYAQEFGIRASGSQEAWQRLVLAADSLMERRVGEYKSLNLRISQVEAAGTFTSSDERRFQQLVRREGELEGRLSSLDSRLRLAEANVHRIEKKLETANQSISKNNILIKSLRRNGDVIDFENYDVREYATTDWESFSLFDDYGQISPNEISEKGQDGSDQRNQTTIEVAQNNTPDTDGSKPGRGDPVDIPDVSDPTDETTSGGSSTTPSGNGGGTVEVGGVAAGGSGSTSTGENSGLDTSSNPVGFMPPTWKGRMSLTGRVNAGFNPATGIVEEMDASGSAPINEFILFNPDTGSIDTPIQGTQTSASLGHSFQHLIWGDWVGETRTWTKNSGYPVESLSGFFVYGELTPSSARASGRAIYTGRLRGDFIEPDGEMLRNTASGDFALTADFSSGMLGGWLAISEVGVENYIVVTDIDNAHIQRTADYLKFWGDLGSDTEGVSGDIQGYFYGSNASEIGGTYKVNNTNEGGSSYGILLGWETDSFPDRPADKVDESNRKIAIVSTQQINGGISDAGADIDRIPTQASTLATISLPSSIGGGTVTTTQVRSDNGFNHTSWGRWGANTDTPSSYSSGGFWVAGDTTPASTIRNLSGTATYSGEILGNHVNTSTGTRTEASGNINLQANFDTDVISGDMTFNQNGNTSPTANISSPISDSGSFFQSTNDDSKSFGFNGALFGGEAQEAAGAAWMRSGNDSYNGVFRAKQ